MNRHPWQQGISLLVLTSLLSACASIGPERTPSAPLSAQRLALSSEASVGPQADWWQQLHDDQLNALIERSLKDAPSMKMAADRLAQARAALGLDESTLGPHVDATATVNRSLFSNNGEYAPLFGGQYINDYTMSINAGWELDFWGKNRARVQSALGQTRAAAYEAQQAQLTLTQAVIGQYTALQRSLDQIRINQARIRIAQTQLQLVRARVSAGMVSADNLDAIEQGIAGLQRQNAAIRGDIQRARHALAALSGQNPGALDNLVPGPLGDTPRVNGARLSADLLGRRPDIASQRERVASMEADVQAARAEFYPDVNISSLIGLDSLQYGTLFHSDSKIVGFQPAITLPIFHSGQLRANLRVAQTTYDQAVDDYNQSVLNGLKDAADALTGQQQATSQLAEARTGLEASRKRAEAMTLRLKAGIVAKLDVLDSQDNQLAQEGALLEAQASARLAWSTLNTAMGGGLAAGPATR